jgi:hypothetical protein
LLILLQAGARSSIKLAGLIAAVEISLLQHSLNLLDLIRAGAKDWFPVGVSVPGRVRLVAGGAGVAVLREGSCRKQQN